MINDDDYKDKVFEQYKDKYKDFKTSFGILLGFAVIFFFIILLPHFSLIHDKNYLIPKLSQLSNETYWSKIAENKTKELIINISNSEKLQNNTRDYLKANEINVSALDYPGLKRGGVCNYDNLDLNKPECKIINNILVNMSISSIIQPLSRISYESPKFIMLHDYFFKLKNLSNNLNYTLSKKLDYIKYFEQKGTLIKDLFDEINKVLDLDIISTVKSDLESNSINLQKLINQTDKSITEVNNRVSQVSTPIGQLPITIQEAISIFPLSLGIGSLISTFLLLDSVKLRDKIHNYYKKQGLSDNDIMNIAPSWIDKLKCKKDRTIKFLIYNIPFAIFIISSILILYEWTFLNKVEESTGVVWTFPGGEYNNYIIFSVSYIVSLVFFIYGYKKLIVYL